MTTVNAPTATNTLIGLCAHDGRVDMETVKGLLGIATLATAVLENCGTSHVGLARNKTAAAFLRTPTAFEWLVLIDTDIGFTVHDFKALVSEWEKLVVIAPYPKKTREYLMNPNNSENVVMYGMGFCLIHRSVFVKILADMPVPCMIAGKIENDFFPSGVIGTDLEGHRHYVTEDVGFWSLCDAVGFPPHLITTTNLRHVGRYIFGG